MGYPRSRLPATRHQIWSQATGGSPQRLSREGNLCLQVVLVVQGLFQMAQQCPPNEYFDRLLNACKPCHLRCSNTPPLICQRYCNTVKGTNAILWTCLGLSLLLSLTVFVLMILLRKMSSEPSKDKFKSTGSPLQNKANADLDDRKASRTGEEILSRSLEYTVEDCTCEDCVKSQPKVDSDHFFPLPAMEEGATILVTTKTNGYCSGLLAAESLTRMEKSISTR
ncbi:tumor necrosis factor receptor superfamily member 17 isoform X1 [Myotis lucifugus]|uniref:tumor necrosis factor receptor superfamily member 17 isoform X1 n=2 Tax=Myotis lucifugus TaxID=59463 RepID=UPI000CCC2233|nr:tumor necrosis factor receptor superfamily member 17 isoform X1 [Myotis lucifugus]